MTMTTLIEYQREIEAAKSAKQRENTLMKRKVVEYRCSWCKHTFLIESDQRMICPACGRESGT